VVLDYPYNKKQCGGQIFFSHFKWIPSREEHDTVFSVFPSFDVALMCWDSKMFKSAGRRHNYAAMLELVQSSNSERSDLRFDAYKPIFVKRDMEVNMLDLRRDISKPV
jgi:hypothetical protein